MALEYSLYVDSDLAPRTALEIVVDATAPGSVIEADAGTELYRASPLGGPLMIAMDDSPPPDDPGEVAAYTDRTAWAGLEPRLRVAFRMRKFEDVDAQVTAILAGSLAVLARTGGDALLVFEMDIVWWRHTGGELCVSPEHQEWTPERLALLPEPHVMDESLRAH